ncbi:MAG: hypothetical protein IPN93_09600 [Bacteroidetes bacterium]|nr:hypothetical protein [Bacteroidota bacterium]
MKHYYKYTFTVFLTIIICSAKTDEEQFDEYLGGRFGYSVVNIKLYNDSTYYYSEWNHTGRSIKDNGKWKKINDHYYLSSTSKTRWTGRNGKSNKIYRFESQEFNITNDTLRLIPKVAKDQAFFDSYYTFKKVINSKQ